MIEIVVLKSSGKISGFSFSGHAGAGIKGNDPICASVSTIVSVLIIGLTKVCSSSAQISEDKAANRIEIKAAVIDEKTSVLLETIYELVIILSKKYAQWILVKEVDNGIRFKCS